MSNVQLSDEQAKLRALSSEISEEFETRKTKLKEKLDSDIQKNLDNMVNLTAQCNMDLNEVISLDKDSIIDRLEAIQIQIEQQREALEALQYKLIEDHGADFVVFLKNIELLEKGKAVVIRDETKLYPEYDNTKRIINNLIVGYALYSRAFMIHRLKTNYDNDLKMLQMSFSYKFADLDSMQEVITRQQSSR
jgi:hypothetical protein